MSCLLQPEASRPRCASPRPLSAISYTLHATRYTLHRHPRHPHHPQTLTISRSMVALHRDARARDAPMSDCCARTLVQHLAFDPELQDRVWYSTRSARRNPALRCSGYSNGGTCDLPNLLDRLGFDPVAQTISWQRSKEPPGRKDLQLGALRAHLSLFSTRMC